MVSGETTHREKRCKVKRRTFTTSMIAAAAATAMPTWRGARAQSPAVQLHVQTLNFSSDAALHLGIQHGFFAEEGLELQVSAVPNPAAGIAALQSGHSDVAYGALVPSFTAIGNGIALRFLAPADGFPMDASEASARYDGSSLFAAKDSGITRPRELEGESVAVAVRRGQSEVTTANAIKADGGDPDKVKWIVLDQSSAVQALNAGRIAAAVLNSPFSSMADEAGHKHIASPGLAFFEHGAVGVWVTSQSALESKREPLLAFRRAIIKSNAYASEHFDEAYDKAAEFTKIPKEVLTSGPLPVWVTELEQESVDRVAKKMTDLGYLNSLPDTSDLIIR